MFKVPHRNAECGQEVRKEKLPMPELFRQILAIGEQHWLNHEDDEMIRWQVGINPDTMEIVPDDSELTDDWVFIVDFSFNVKKAYNIAGDPIRAKILYDLAVITQVNEQLYEDIADWEVDDTWKMI